MCFRIIDALHNLRVTVGDGDVAEHMCYVEEEFYKYFPNLSGNNPWIKLTRNPFLRQVANLPTEAQEKYLELLNDQKTKDSSLTT